MRDDDEFVAFVEQSGSRLRDTAFWLCRDWSLAQDLAQATLIKVYLSWQRIRHDDPYWYCKKVLLRTYLDHKRLKSSAEVQTDVIPDLPAAPDAADSLLRTRRRMATWASAEASCARASRSTSRIRGSPANTVSLAFTSTSLITPITGAASLITPDEGSTRPGATASQRLSSG